jgi:hypothetical protein
MSVTKLKTVGSWPPAPVKSAERTRIRGRVITGLLTGGDARAEAPPVEEDERSGSDVGARRGRVVRARYAPGTR